MRLSTLASGSVRAWAYPARAYRFTRRWPVIPTAVVVLLGVMAIFAPLLAPHDPLRADLSKRLGAPAWMEDGTPNYYLGGDALGRDLLSRTIFGARISLMVAGTVLLAGGIFGTGLGLISGYAGGIWDEVLMRFADMALAIPFIVIALVASVVFGASLGLVIVLLSVTQWPQFSRQVRAETLQLKTNDYVAAARVAGASPMRIILRHILPGLQNTVVVVATLRVGLLILTEAILSFLGIGIPEPTPAWGAMVADGRPYISTAWWVALVPGGAIFLTVFGFNFLGDWFRDYTDPRLRQLN